MCWPRLWTTIPFSKAPAVQPWLFDKMTQKEAQDMMMLLTFLLTGWALSSCPFSTFSSPQTARVSSHQHKCIALNFHKMTRAVRPNHGMEEWFTLWWTSVAQCEKGKCFLVEKCLNLDLEEWSIPLLKWLSPTDYDFLPNFPKLDLFL